MKAVVVLVSLITFNSALAQAILNGPGEAKAYKDLDLQNIKWSEYVMPHYEVKGFSREFLESDFYSLDSFEKAEQVLFQKINLYRQEMGLSPLTWSDTGALVCGNYSKELCAAEYSNHDLNGTTPSSRMKSAFGHSVNAWENLHYFGGTIKPESVDSYTDYILHGWINSSGHNKTLLKEGKLACVGIYSDRTKPNNEHFTISCFNMLYYWRWN